MMRPTEIDLLPPRPEADRPLDAGIVLRALREQFPSQDFAHAAPLAPGWARDPYVVDGQLVAHFPRNAEVAGWLDWDEAILRFVDSALGSILRVPRVRYRGHPGEHFPHGFLVCEFISGVPLDSTDDPLSKRLARELGEALAHIHTVPVDSAAEVGVEQPEWDTFTGARSFLHGDFGPSNIVVDPSTGRLEGIIDWGNVQLGDRARDFHKLVLDCGWNFTKAVLQAYGLSRDEQFLDRVRFYAQFEAAQWLADSVRRGLDPAPHLEWVRNAFSFDMSYDPDE